MLVSSTLLNQVALIGTEALIIARAPRVARGRGRAGVALANHLAVSVVVLTTTPEVKGGLDVGAAHLHIGGIRVGDMLRCNWAALVEGALTGSSSNNRLILNVHNLIVIERELCAVELASCGTKEAESRKLHCAKTKDPESETLRCELPGNHIGKCNTADLSCLEQIKLCLIRAHDSLELSTAR